jgi:hypothetical protein
MENRRFHRVTFSTSGVLAHHDLTYAVRLENLSLRGAMISSNECIMIPLGETCSLSFSPGGDAPPISLTAEVVHCFFSMVGVKFVTFPDDCESRVYELLKSITPEPAKLEREWSEILGHETVATVAA